jgi:hypothetical protein
MRSVEPASLLSPRTSRDSLTPEQHIGSLFASFVGALAAGILEQQRLGRTKRETFGRASEAMAELAMLKMDRTDFDNIARSYGRQVLCAYLAMPPHSMMPNEKMLSKLIELALALLTDFLKKMTN